MSNKSEWQEANRRLMAEERARLGDPPTAEEMLAYSRGEMSESEEERIRELMTVYPELARMYGAAVSADDDTALPEAQVAAGWSALQRRLGGSAASQAEQNRRADAQRGRVLFRHLPATIAAAFALVFFGLFVQAESRARHHAREARLPRILGAPQELAPGGTRGLASPTMLRKDGEAYLLEPHLMSQVRYPHYAIELHGADGIMWTSHSARPDQDDAFQIVIPHDFLRPGRNYQLRIFGVDGKTRTPLGAYDVAVGVE